MANGIAWIDDDVDSGTRQYYIASLFMQLMNDNSTSSSAADSTTGYESSSVRM